LFNFFFKELKIFLYELKKIIAKIAKIKKMKRLKVLSLNNFNIPGVFISIYSYIEDNKSCYCFSQTCKLAYEVFEYMLKKSSKRKQKLLKFLRSKLEDFSFDYFKGNNITKYKLVQKREDFFSRLNNSKFYNNVKSILLKYGGEHMISGGFLVSLFFDKKIEPDQDIDIFLLGQNKVENCINILREIYKKFPKNFRIGILPGLVEILFDNENDLICRYQFILKENAKTPADVWNYFDLDCCKIGLFNQQLICNVDFIRAISTKMNFVSSVTLNKKVYERMEKYLKRYGFLTVFEHSHIMSYFHTFLSSENFNFPSGNHLIYTGRRCKNFLDGNPINHKFLELFGFAQHVDEEFYTKITNSLRVNSSIELELKVDCGAVIENGCDEKMFCTFYGQKTGNNQFKYGRKREFKVKKNCAFESTYVLRMLKLCWHCKKKIVKFDKAETSNGKLYHLKCL